MRYVIAMVVLLGAGIARAEDTGTIVARAATQDGPMAGVTFLAIADDGRTVTAVSGGGGEAVLRGLPPGHYALVAVFGDQKAQVQLDVAAGGSERRGFVFPSAGGEVIRIEEHVGPSRRAEPELETRIGILPYPDEVVEQNLYGVVWLLLDLDVEGKVTQATVLKAQRGVGLEEVALREAKKLRFSPARNDAGTPIPTSIVVVLQWPPFWARASGFGLYAPCAGEGPLNLDLSDNHVVTYVDCKPPPGFERARVQIGNSYRRVPRDYNASYKWSRSKAGLLKQQLKATERNGF